jgi:hypothetical protein
MPTRLRFDSIISGSSDRVSRALLPHEAPVAPGLCASDHVLFDDDRVNAALGKVIRGRAADDAAT